MRNSLVWRFLGISALALAIGSCQLAPVISGPKSPALSPKSRWVSQEALDFITGGGWYSIQLAFATQSGNQATFGFHGGVKNGQWWGNGNYIDHGTGLHVTVTSITGYEKVGTDSTDSNGNPLGTRQICGWADTNLYGTVRFLVQMTDNGEPGSRDRFAIALADPSSGNYVYGSQGSLGDPTPGGGNIQLHKGNASNTLPSTEPDCIPNPFGP